MNTIRSRTDGALILRSLTFCPLADVNYAISSDRLWALRRAEDLYFSVEKEQKEWCVVLLKRHSSLFEEEEATAGFHSSRYQSSGQPMTVVCACADSYLHYLTAGFHEGLLMSRAHRTRTSNDWKIFGAVLKLHEFDFVDYLRWNVTSKVTRVSLPSKPTTMLPFLSFIVMSLNIFFAPLPIAFKS